MPEKKSELLHKVAQRLFEAATSNSLGETFHVIVSFHLQKKFCKDPFEVFVENPGLFYTGLKDVMGEGANALLTLVVTFIKVKYAIDLDTKEITRLFTDADANSPKKLAELLNTIICQEEKKVKK
ncbi:MAG: hypothetical protein N3D85_07020 [Candidatus Bathyarchaeota archaeon]|nr:hypothetical protein [Candidatus Bathyarchaeota archaeon]